MTFTVFCILIQHFRMASDIKNNTHNVVDKICIFGSVYGERHWNLDYPKGMNAFFESGAI